MNHTTIFMSDKSTWTERNIGTLKNTGAALEGGGFLLSGWSAYQGAKAGAQALGANADTLEKQADNTLAQTRQNLIRARLNQTVATGQATAVRGARNIMADGSGLDNERTAMQAAEIEINDMGARALEEAQNLRHQAAMQRWEAQQKKRAGKLSFISNGLSAAGAVIGGIAAGPVGAAAGSNLGGGSGDFLE